MSRGRHQNHHHPQQTGSASQQQQQQTTPRRGNRTLGWYLSDKLAHGENRNMLFEEDSSLTGRMAAKTSSAQQHRKGSLEPTSNSRTSPKIATSQQKQLMRQNRQPSLGRPRANSSTVAKKPTLFGTNLTHNNQPDQSSPQVKGTSNQPTNNEQQQRMGKGFNSGNKENYWYYDEVSDGFYYEHNGTRGWRKRNAKLEAVMRAAELQKGVLDEVGQKPEQQNEKGETEVKGQQFAPVPSLLAPHQLNKLITVPNGAAANPLVAPSAMNIKYFDNEGYFYEMASVDGWRRRQPGVSPPNSLASSLGAQAKGFSQSQQSPSPVQVSAPRRKVQPAHYQAYQQPQMNPLDLQEMIMMAQQQHFHHGHGGQTSCCCQPQQCCCNTIAAMAAQIVLQKQQNVNNPAPRKNDGRFETNIAAGEVQHHHQDNNIPSLLDSLSIGKQYHPHLHQSRTTASSSPMDLMQNRAGYGAGNYNWERSNGRNWNINNGHQQNNNNDMLGGKEMGIGNVSSGKATGGTTQTQSVGSFEEHYEFFWSGDEASSETEPQQPATVQTKPIGNNNGNGGLHQSVGVVPVPAKTETTLTATSVSSMEDDGLEEIIGRHKGTLAPIGSEASSAFAQKKRREEKQRTNGIQSKRPDSLKLTCSKPAFDPTMLSAANAPPVTGNSGKDGLTSPAVAYMSGHFDVDKFIEQLPPMPINHEHILHSLRNPGRTPMGPPAVEPSTADSPLFTPNFYGSRDPWPFRPLPPQAENPWSTFP